jgi:phosphate transport system permease protein
MTLDKSTLLLMQLLLSVLAFHWGKIRAARIAEGSGERLHSLPSYYGYYTAFWSALPALLLILIWSIFESVVITRSVLSLLPESTAAVSPEQLSLVINDVRNVAEGVVSDDPTIQAAADRYVYLQGASNGLLTLMAALVSIGAGAFASRQIQPTYRARNKVEGVLNYFLVACAALAVLTTVGIVLSVFIESIRFFSKIPVTDFLFGLKWSPQIAMRADQVGSSGAFGVVPLLMGTALISLVAMTVSVPIGLLSAIYLSEYAAARFRAIAKPLLEILAGIPTVVYGFFAALVVAPFVRELGTGLGLDVSSESALAAGLVMGIMIIPFVSSLSDDFINAVPQSLRDGAYALGATQSETIRQVVMPAALPGIVGGVLLAVSRAIGETMIVVMAAGLSANLTFNPLKAVTTVTTQIVTLLVGDQEFDSPKTLAAFALGLLLFMLTLALNVLALRIVRKYREQYE